MEIYPQSVKPAVSVVIPHLNGIQHLEVCLGSLRSQSFRSFEVILVDNGSTDGSQDYVRSIFPEVKLLQLEENKGFTGACNAGYAASLGDIIVLLNNDTEVKADWLAELVDTFKRVPEAASVASKMLLFDQRDHFHTAGDYYQRNGIPGNRGIWQVDSGQYDQEEFVFSACGGAAAYRRSTLEQLGFLDDDYFFSCEDVDMGWRIHLSGQKVLYNPRAIVYHKLKASADGGASSSYYDGRNFLYLIWKNYPTSLLRKYWPSVLKAQLTITVQALRSWRGKDARARLRGQMAGLWGIFKMVPKRRLIQGARIADDYTLESALRAFDDTP